MVSMREVTSEDEAFLRKVYACTRAQEMALVPWDEEQREAFLNSQFDAQDKHYRSTFPEASFEIILNELEPIGRLYVLREATETRILDITILPEHRSAGIGTSLIRQLLEEADQNQGTVTIWVEQFNPSQALFQRLGFSIIQDDGYSNLLKYDPRPNGATGG